VLESAQDASREKRATSTRCRSSTTPPDPPSPDQGESRTEGEQPDGDQPVTSISPSLERPENPQEYFDTKCISLDRRSRLVKATKAFLEAKIHSDTKSYEDMWSAKKGLFTGHQGVNKLCRLQRGRKELASRMAENKCANALSILFVAHEIDFYERTCCDLKLASGRSRKSLLLEKLAKSSNISKKNLKADYYKSPNYFILLREMGPGSVFYLESQVASK
jgi:hypothetical protein